jgi:hypothetical protein
VRWSSTNHRRLAGAAPTARSQRAVGGCGRAQHRRRGRPPTTATATATAAAAAATAAAATTATAADPAADPDVGSSTVAPVLVRDGASATTCRNDERGAICGSKSENKVSRVKAAFFG